MVGTAPHMVSLCHWTYVMLAFTHADNAGVIVNNKGEMKGMYMFCFYFVFTF